jgi:ligand-binding SRPBCC domain-containing protein
MLRSELWLPRPLEEVFAFFADAQNLEQITPRLLQFSIVTPTPIPMCEGVLIDYRLKIRGFPMRWRTRLAEWDPPHRFADEQLKGPYVRWYHRHRFVERNGGTDVLDEVEILPPGGPLAPLVFRLFVRSDVERIFRYRAQALCAHFGGLAESVTVDFTRCPDDGTGRLLPLSS